MLIVAASNHSSPIAFTPKEAGNPQGVAIDVVRAISQELKLPVQFLTGVAWSRSIAWLDDGTIDLLAGVYWTKERATKWSMTDPILFESTRAYQNIESLPDPITIDTIHSFRGGVIRSSSYGETFERIKTTLSLFRTTGELELFKMLAANRLDYVVAGEWDAQGVIKAINKESVIVPSNVELERNGIHLAFNKKQRCAHLVEQFNPIIQRLHETGQIQKLLTSYQNASSHQVSHH